jgi:hypothetical protein
MLASGNLHLTMGKPRKSYYQIVGTWLLNFLPNAYLYFLFFNLLFYCFYIYLHVYTLCHLPPAPFLPPPLYFLSFIK